jgi:hypothetical protein
LLGNLHHHLACLGTTLSRRASRTTTIFMTFYSFSQNDAVRITKSER